MYACVLVQQNSRDSAMQHYIHAQSIIHEDLERCDPFTILALMQLGWVVMGYKSFQHHLCLAVKLCCFFGFDRDADFYWYSSIGKIVRARATQDDELARFSSE